MIKNLKTIAIALAFAGVTAGSVYATTPPAGTNVLQSLNINLTCYQQYVPGASTYGTATAGGTNSTGTKITYHPFTITTKDIVDGIVTDFGLTAFKDAKLVLATIYSNQITYLGSNGFSSTNITIVSNGTSPVLYIGGTNSLEYVYINTNTYQSAVILYTNGDVFVASNNGTYIGSTTNNLVTLADGTNSVTMTFPTNAGTSTTFTFQPTNGTATNVVIATTSYTPTNSYVAQEQNVELLAGTAAAPIYTNVGFLFEELYVYNTVTNTAGKFLNTTNMAVIDSSTAVGFADASFGYVGTSSGSSNVHLSLGGFAKGVLKTDIFIPKKGTNSAVTSYLDYASLTASVSGQGYTGGTYITNTSGGQNASSYFDSYGYPLAGATTNNSGEITGVITNATRFIATGTITATFLKNDTAAGAYDPNED